MDLPINNEELKELMDALNESNHPDAMKRQFRNELHRKLRLTKFLIEEGCLLYTSPSPRDDR